MSLTVTVPADAPALERGAAAAYLLGTLIADFNLLPPEHRKQLRGVAAHLIDALDEYESAPAAAPRVEHELNELELQAACREIAEAFGHRLPGVGYALLLFGGARRTVYVSNVARPQMLAALREFLERAAAAR